MKIGIDKLAFYVPQYYLDMTDLAHARDTDPNKFHIGLGQDKMAVLPATQDIVSMGANAAEKILTDEDRDLIDMVIVGTESGIDYSKSAAVMIHHLLKIQPFARSYEIKHACYGGTAALQQAKEYVKNHSERKVLVIASDIAKYGLDTPGEPTQGAGAVAMLVSADPRILELQDDSIFYSEDVYDFWRPNGHDYPLVDGHLSNEVYIQAFLNVWEQNKKVNHLTEADYTSLIFHLPYTKMGHKALKEILPDMTAEKQAALSDHYDLSTQYSRQVGNLYTGSLYLGLTSLLENASDLKAGDRIGMFSYGSGAVSEFFSGILAADFEKQLLKNDHQALLAERRGLSMAQYETMFNETLADAAADTSVHYLKKIENNIRYYH